MSPLRVAMLTGTVAGGTGVHAAMLARGCAARGVAVSVFGPESGRQQFAAVPVQFRPVEIGDRPRPVRDAAATARLRRLLVRTEPDVVHAHGLRAGALAAVALAAVAPQPAARRVPRPSRRGPRPALLVTVHNAPPASRRAGIVYRALELVVARRADCVLCVSPDLAGRMRRLGAREVRRAVVAAPSADPPALEDVARARASIGADGRPVVLAAGRLAPQKGYDVLLAAAVAWQRGEPVPLLVIAGEGPLARELSARSQAAGLDVRFLGHRADMPALLTAADVVVVPSRWEGQPLFVQEAIRAGRPMVATRVGGIPDLTGENAALLVPPGDPVALADAVTSVLGDRDLQASLAAAGLSRASGLPSESEAVEAALGEYRRLAARRALADGRITPHKTRF